MSYSARNISQRRQIEEGLSDGETDFGIENKTIDNAIITGRSDRVQKIVMGINPEFDTHMSMTEWASMLDAIQATPDQRRVHEETLRIQQAAESDTRLTSSDLFSDEGDPDRYVEEE